MADANCRCTLADVRAAMPGLTAAGVARLEERFPPYRVREYREAARIARLPLAASVHFVASIGNAGWFEGNGSADHPLRTRMCSSSYELRADGTVSPLSGAGLGVDVDEEFIRARSLPPGASMALTCGGRGGDTIVCGPVADIVKGPRACPRRGGRTPTRSPAGGLVEGAADTAAPARDGEPARHPADGDLPR
jgi:hypothetical protein